MTGRRSSPQDESQPPVVADVAEAMEQLGWRIPTDARAVARAQDELAEQIRQAQPPAFDHLQAGPAGKRRIPRLDPRGQAEVRGLAARNAADIPPEILHRMREDRLRAEAEQAGEPDEPGDA